MPNATTLSEKEIGFGYQYPIIRYRVVSVLSKASNYPTAFTTNPAPGATNPTLDTANQ